MDELSFDAPIPGEALTTAAGNRPWEKPPQYSTVEDALEYYVPRLTDTGFENDLLDTMELGVPVTTMAGTTSTLPELVQKYEPFFQEIEKDSNKTKGINVWHVPNPETGLNDITMIQFDMRMFQKEEVQQQIAAQQAFQTVLNQQAQVLNPSTTVQAVVPPIAEVVQ